MYWDTFPLKLTGDLDTKVMIFAKDVAINRALRRLREASFKVILHIHTQALDWTLEKGEATNLILTSGLLSNT